MAVTAQGLEPGRASQISTEESTELSWTLGCERCRCGGCIVFSLLLLTCLAWWLIYMSMLWLQVKCPVDIRVFPQ